MSMKLFLAAAVIVASTGVASAATLFSDDFESKRYKRGTPGSLAPTWFATEGNVDVISAPAFPWYPSHFIDMNGSGGGSTAARISTVIKGFKIGAKYSLAFQYGANKNSNQNADDSETLIYKLLGNNNKSEALNGRVVTNGPVPNMLSAFFTFTATDEDLKLVFRDIMSGGPDFDDDNDRGGPILDNVRVESLAAVPLPAGAPLLLAGLGGLALLRRRRKA